MGHEGLRVLVTRPDGAGTARRLAALGHRPLLLPLSRVAPLPQAETPGPAIAVAATSANALSFAAPATVGALRAKPLFAVGPRTAEAAREHGFADIRTGPGDASGLARLILSEGVPSLVYLCGRVRRPDLERALGAGGVRVEAVETYDTLPLEPSPAALAASLGQGPADAVLLFSVAAAVAFGQLRLRPDAAPLVTGAVPFALSERVLQALAPAGAARGFAAALPNEDALFALFSRVSSQRGQVW